MTNVHIIRLRGPWEVVPLAASGATPLRLMLPGDWRVPLGDYLGPAKFCRYFQRPTSLSHKSQVKLAVSGLPKRRVVRCNENVLSPLDDPDRYDLTCLLTPRNQLVVELEITTATPVKGDVWLEISEPGCEKSSVHESGDR